MDDRTMYMCMEIIALINLLRGKKSPPPPPTKKKQKKNNDIPAPSFFLKIHLLNVPYISGHVPNRVFLLSVNVRTPKTCPLFLIKLLFSLPEYFVYLLCLPVFLVSVIDKPLCLICIH